MDIPLGSQPRPNRGPWFLAALALLGIGVVVFAGLSVGGRPSVQITTDKPAIGREAAVDVKVREPGRGLVRIAVALVQGQQRIELAEKTFTPRSAWWPWGPKTDESVLSLVVGKDHQPVLSEGHATIEVIASGASTWMFDGPQTEERTSLPVRLTPPPIAVTTTEVYVTQGGAEVVTYTVGETSVRDGVLAGDWFFAGYPRPGGDPKARMALFAVPYDMSNVDNVKIVAEDDIGNRAEVSFINNFRKKPYDTDTINVSRLVMAKVVPKIRAQTPGLPDKGSLLDNYIAINRDLRKKNNARLVELAKKTRPKVLWSKPFVQMPAKVVSSFADRRTYRFEGKVIDQQDHLGFDLAQVRHAEIPAANEGVVVMAEYLGIYGNTVVIDHGLGLMSLYAHCSQMDVAVGDRVTRGQIIGRTGSTGLALGDHLHFTMLLSGLPVTPIEWWDPHWISDRIARKLPGIFKTGKE